MTIDIKFFVGREAYAARYLDQVPRVGDEIMLGAGKSFEADKDGKAAFKVIRVVWGVERPRSNRQAVNIELEHIP